MNHDVFISYSSQNKVAAQAICHTLEENGIKCWMAPRDIPPGSEYGDLIDLAIKSAKVFVVLFSKQAATSLWVKGELSIAFEEQKVIIPFRLDNTPLQGQNRVMLNQKHWIDAYPDYKTKFNELVSAVAQSIGKGIGTETTNDDASTLEVSTKIIETKHKEKRVSLKHIFDKVISVCQHTSKFWSIADLAICGAWMLLLVHQWGFRSRLVFLFLVVLRIWTNFLMKRRSKLTMVPLAILSLLCPSLLSECNYYICGGWIKFLLSSARALETFSSPIHYKLSDSFGDLPLPIIIFCVVWLIAIPWCIYIWHLCKKQLHPGGLGTLKTIGLCVYIPAMVFVCAFVEIPP